MICTFLPARFGALALCLAAVVGCASAGGSADGDTVSGLFDESGNESYGGSGYREAPGAAPSYAGAPMEEAEAMPAPVAMTTADDAPSRGAFDFLGEAIDGAFAKKNMPAPAPQAGSTPPPPPPPPPRPDDPDAGKPAVDKPAEASEGGKPAKRQVIYTGSVQVMVTNVVESADKLQARVEELGGFMLNRQGNTASNNVTLTVRSPAEHFHALVKELATFGQILNEQLAANDVTKQMFDLALRLETAERSRQRLLDLLKSATKMEEILQIENQVRRLTDEIERMKGELRFLADQVAFSTLTVSFFSNAPPPTPGPLRTRSRFEWINQVGVEQVLGGF
ncbi:MAG: DUF4349 domain-containing protein [Deltaproteobacteria bacterium]|nr:DUF4349 domain-containing protein [Deltaproteobacteria bacterium]